MVPWYCKCVCRIFWIVPFVVSQENDKILQKMPKVKSFTIYERIIISTCWNESNIFFMLRDKKWLFSEWYFWIGLLWCIKVSKFLKIYFLMVICLIISSVLINAWSFYRSQNALSWSKFFCARPNIDLHIAPGWKIISIK